MKVQAKIPPSIHYILQTPHFLVCEGWIITQQKKQNFNIYTTPYSAVKRGREHYQSNNRKKNVWEAKTCRIIIAFLSSMCLQYLSRVKSSAPVACLSSHWLRILVDHWPDFDHCCILNISTVWLNCCVIGRDNELRRRTLAQFVFDSWLIV